MIKHTTAHFLLTIFENMKSVVCFRHCTIHCYDSLRHTRLYQRKYVLLVLSEIPYTVAKQVKFSNVRETEHHISATIEIDHEMGENVNALSQFC